MKKLMTALAALLIVIVGVLVPQAANAATSSSSSDIARTPLVVQSTQSSEAFATTGLLPKTGQYEYICIGIDGNSWSLASGEPTTDCHGSYLHKYINGVMVANYHLAYGGGAAQNPPGNIGCVLAIAGAVSLFYFPPTGVAAWVVNGGLAAAGLLVSCTA